LIEFRPDLQNHVWHLRMPIAQPAKSNQDFFGCTAKGPIEIFQASAYLPPQVFADLVESAPFFCSIIAA
jgi:hypothetical protein